MLIITPMVETDERIAHFLGDCNEPNADYVFWNYSRGTYRHVLKMLGFDIVRITSQSFLMKIGGETDHLRSIITARRFAP